MAGRRRAVHAWGMVELIVVAFTAVAFVAIVAAVPVELGEERGDEREVRADR